MKVVIEMTSTDWNPSEQNSTITLTNQENDPFARRREWYNMTGYKPPFLYLEIEKDGSIVYSGWPYEKPLQ